jgi:FkbM family methyltransferase
MKQRAHYGIYTVGDESYFPGIAASINSLRYYGYTGAVAVIDIGFNDWMRSYLRAYENVTVLDIDPVRNNIRFTDVLTDESPVMKGWAYKAFSILHYDLFDSWTFLDADYFPMCNPEQELYPLIREGCLVSTEDGHNTWDHRHYEAVGVQPGNYMNINAGFVSLSMEKHGYIVHEWRNLMTRHKPFELWYGDQGALNAVLDKYSVTRTCVDKHLWNQTWLNEVMAKENNCRLVEEDNSMHVIYEPVEKKIMGWHGTGWHKLWNQLGIDHHRKNEEERARFYADAQGKSPGAIVDIFARFLFMDKYNRKLYRNGFLLQDSPANKVFIDCGMREGDAVAAFLGDREVGGGAYYNCLRPRHDQDEFRFIGFESPDYAFMNDTRKRFGHKNLRLEEKIVWTHDGTVEFDSDGESLDCRIYEVSKTAGQEPWRHPNPSATVKQLECIDLAGYLMSNFTSGDYVIVKLDIEGAEYDVLKRLIDSGAIALIKELYVEYHWWGNAHLREEIENHIKGWDIYYRNDWP